MKGNNMMTKKRAQFILPDQTIGKLDRLKRQMGASSRTEVLKTAVELLNWAVSHLARGEEIAAIGDDGVAETIAIPSGYPSNNV
jgi:hypothetical protein